jgi:hypothetical protein
MPTSTEIANSALVKLGQQRITSLDEDNARAIFLNEQYEKIKKAILASHPWNFAIARAELAQDATDPEFEWTYRYPLPADCLRVLNSETGEEEYVIEGAYILTDEETFYIRYISDADETYFSPFFAEALAAALAADVAYAITQSSAVQANMQAQAKEMLALARAMDAKEGVPAEIRVNSWLDERY